MLSYYILTFDTSMNACSVGVYDAHTDKMVASQHESMPRGQAEKLLPMINDVLEKSSICYDNLSAIACTHGPGAFTGLRIGIATAKSLSLSLSIPAIGISTIDALAEEYLYTHKPDFAYLICLETNRNDYYVGLFSHKGEPLSSADTLDLYQIYELLEKNNIHKANVVGNATLRIQEEFTKYLKNNNEVPALSFVNIPYVNCLFLAKKSYIKLKEIDQKKKRLVNILPLYLKKPNITISSPKG